MPRAIVDQLNVEVNKKEESLDKRREIVTAKLIEKNDDQHLTAEKAAKIESVVDEPNPEKYVDPISPSTKTTPVTSVLPQPKATKKFASTEYMKMLSTVHHAIFKKELHPEINDAGTSGSYFCKDISEETVAVFKPHDEEPYAEANPKWGKWFQRALPGWFFGRAMLVDNTGYVSEAMAWKLCDKMGWKIVPETHVVRLAAPTFFYKDLPDRGDGHHPKELPPKKGSLQLFVQDIQPAKNYLPNVVEKIGSEMEEKYRRQFEHLVLLDYVTRQTDRQDDWFLRLTKDESENVTDVELFALDNGLAFPWKHPDEVRAYPFGWLSLPDANKPFSKETCEHVLKLFDDAEWREELEKDLHKIAKVSNKMHAHFHKIMEVVRGQMWNVMECLRVGGTPTDLCNLPPRLASEHAQTGGLLVREYNKQPLLSFW